jgi:hypothetical protein
MLIRRSQKKRNAEPQQKQNHRSVVIDPMVNPGGSAHRHQARSRANPTRTYHRMVAMAQSSPGDRSACALQSKTTTVMLGREPIDLPADGLPESAMPQQQLNSHCQPQTRMRVNLDEKARRPARRRG